MTLHQVVVLAALGVYMINNIKEGVTSPSDVTILLSAGQGVRSLGGSIPLTVRYVNRGKAQVSFREPPKTWEVHLLVGRPKEEPQEVALGRIFYYKSGDMVRRTIEDAETINLAPGATYEFPCDPGERWPELFVPGVNLMRIKDLTNDDKTVLSNTIEVHVAYDLATFPRLLKILSNEQSTVDSRQFAGEWIKRLHPGFDHARGGISEARIWWTKHENDPDTLKRIEVLNREPATHSR